MNEHNIIGAILAGGQSKRMGKDKLFLKLNNTALIDHTIKKVKKYFDFSGGRYQISEIGIEVVISTFDIILASTALDEIKYLFSTRVRFFRASQRAMVKHFTNLLIRFLNENN